MRICIFRQRENIRNYTGHFLFCQRVVIVHLVFDAVTIYTVNHLEQVPIAVNDAFHRVFVGTMAGVLYLFYRYIAAVVEEETKKKMIFDWPAKIFLIVLEIIALVFPIDIQTPNGNYSAGAYVIASYGGVMIYRHCVQEF